MSNGCLEVTQRLRSVPGSSASDRHRPVSSHRHACMKSVVGAKLGAELGMSLGALLGASLGMKLGITLGDADGAGDGAGVG